MELRQRLEHASQALLGVQNPDGGIPATKRGELSGCWTTADTLDAIISAQAFASAGIGRLRRMVVFLLTMQLGSESRKEATERIEVGGWPLINSGHGSTMATGHAMAALLLAKKLFDDDYYLSGRIDQAIRGGFQWLERHQNSDGGWGSQPGSGGDGQESRIVATYYALRAYWTSGQTVRSSGTLLRAAQFLERVTNTDGSWGYGVGHPGDISNTARAVTALVRSGQYDPSNTTIKRGIRFIVQHQSAGGLWDLAHEGFIYKDESGQIIYNNSCVHDVLVALLTTRTLSSVTHDALAWYVGTQQDNGLWTLSSPQTRVAQVYTWPTAEWIYTVGLAVAAYSAAGSEVTGATDSKTYTFWRISALIGWPIAVIALLYSLGLWTFLVNWWSGLSSSAQNIITVGVLLAIAVNVAAAFMYDRMKLAGRKILRKPPDPNDDL